MPSRKEQRTGERCGHSECEVREEVLEPRNRCNIVMYMGRAQVDGRTPTRDRKEPADSYLEPIHIGF